MGRIHLHLAVDAEIVGRFLDEARAVARGRAGWLVVLEDGGIRGKLRYGR